MSVFLGYSFIRRHWRTDTESNFPFHQNSVSVSVSAPMLTCLAPLNRCEVRSPGHEVVATRLEAALLVTDAPLTNHAPTEIACGIPSSTPATRCCSDSKCVHRTHVTPEMSAVRYSIEIRFVATSLAPSEWVSEQGELLVTIPRR